MSLKARVGRLTFVQSHCSVGCQLRVIAGNEIVFNPVVGIGPPFVATQCSGRFCCGTGCEPHDADKIVGRWQLHEPVHLSSFERKFL
jgi:hypothetical protein